MTHFPINRLSICFFVTFIALSLLSAAIATDGDPVSGLVERNWTVDGVARSALVGIPPTDTKSATPVVFAFHGRGGDVRSFAERFAIHKLWPEAIAVYSLVWT